ncbi:MAG: hypothetical protein PHP01_05670 [Phycisphaerae bacterium]|nr:hypothetical protein [Phycisphaerae bacterium]
MKQRIFQGKHLIFQYVTITVGICAGELCRSVSLSGSWKQNDHFGIYRPKWTADLNQISKTKGNL